MLIVYIYISLIYETDIYMHIIYIIYILYISYTSDMSTICVCLCVYTHIRGCVFYIHICKICIPVYVYTYCRQIEYIWRYIGYM